MKFSDQYPTPTGSLASINDQYLADEQPLVQQLLDIADIGEEGRARIGQQAGALVRAVRENTRKDGGIDAFLQQYDLSSQEGVLLMCIAEALLRIPDADTADKLIADKVTSANWQDHLGESDSLFVNASTWGLMLTGNLLKLDEATIRDPAKYLGKLVGRAGEPVVRTAMRQAMKIMGHQFVMGRTIEDALERAQSRKNRIYRYSFDMLGEAALRSRDADRYFEAYQNAITSIGEAGIETPDIFSAPGISVKLSALHPRYSYTQEDHVVADLVPKLRVLAGLARDAGVGLTVDSEEADRLQLTLRIIEGVYRDASLGDYEGFGFAVQSYQRRATDVVRFLVGLSREKGRRIPVRLVKGAYWDSEIKRGQEQGLESYPVFTRKVHSDVSYLACARLLLDARKEIYPQFATHNAHTLASVVEFAGERTDYEFQRLHGMGEELYAEVVSPEKLNRACRVYAPVGSHEDLLPYLVRRLLENGANTSFVNRIIDEDIPVEDIVADPIVAVRMQGGLPHTKIPSPADIYQPDRKNSTGINLPNPADAQDLLRAMDEAAGAEWAAAPIVDGQRCRGDAVASRNPARTEQVVGICQQAAPELVDRAIAIAASEQKRWDRVPASDRARILNRAADLFEANRAQLMAMCVREAGKTIPDALSEVREAVDFLRYYAWQAEQHFADAIVLPGPTGERNTLGLRGRGVFVCISPWNFPLAIFTGQVAAALAAGNAVIAKPAEQTPLVACRAVELLLEAGVPPGVLHFLPGEGGSIGARAVGNKLIAGVAFTGSTETARLINQTLAAGEGAIPVLIAETGGQNALIVDSSALPEQVVLDSVYSAFNSAGQRCSALRLLCVQKDIAPRVKELLAGYMQELRIGDPARLSTDVGPVIDEDALGILDGHIDYMTTAGKAIHRCELPRETAGGTFFAPAAFEIESIDVLQREVFGPVLHVLTFRNKDLANVMEAVNKTGYGLTMGIHSRIDDHARQIVEASGAGNIYINRNMIGAVVGSQPFGGRGLSGTGPKAGGPHYLFRFANEFTVSNNIAAVGGNASLLSLSTD
jgi:RHH-type proline utilization regulon transcriptional repressor/proline dehydrogenase/delta 1-pyrroline-5-carboxylate dehydrogenase